LLKAEALLMRHLGTDNSDNEEAMKLVNEVRKRSNLEEREFFEDIDFKTLMDYVLYERLMELVGEGKAWYDLLRLGRYKDPSGTINFVKDFLIENVTKYDQQARETWITSVLSDENAWYLPVYYNEITVNPLLEQNPYYE
ncbi:MAG: RagB/SusD family nutrient uptake outer membrane protein, partial [Prevotella sp.]|nr:RagB/SusD family nutrient uptake outer membrane protein [Prevotella sp.]